MFFMLWRRSDHVREPLVRSEVNKEMNFFSSCGTVICQTRVPLKKYYNPKSSFRRSDVKEKMDRIKLMTKGKTTPRAKTLLS
jgi:hypothetical protein